MTDGKGKTIECKDAVFIMTSNLAADQIAIYGDKLRREANRIDQTKMTTVMTDGWLLLTSGILFNNKRNTVLASASKEIREEVTVSREFKEKVVRPILKVSIGKRSDKNNKSNIYF
jgi:ATP-dependent Clp protease ATP-binding subunit ClpB